MKRGLVLRRETLAELSTADLTAVAGGQYSGEGALSCALTECVTLLPHLIDIRIDTQTGSRTCPTLIC
ncbi:MAG TPA: hypothetical protein VF519_10415 [Mycobacteriales bacterium]|jgi:hypothetical protein